MPLRKSSLISSNPLVATPEEPPSRRGLVPASTSIPAAAPSAIAASGLAGTSTPSVTGPEEHAPGTWCGPFLHLHQLGQGHLPQRNEIPADLRLDPLGHLIGFVKPTCTGCAPPDWTMARWNAGLTLACEMGDHRSTAG